MKLLGTACYSALRRTRHQHPPRAAAGLPGMHGVADALAHGVKVTGCTVFEVDAGVDTGRILAQEPVRVRPDDTEDTLHERIKVAERALLIDTINALADERHP